MTQVIGGVAYFRIEGKLYTAGEGKFSTNDGGKKYEYKLSAPGMGGATSSMVVPYIKGSLMCKADLSPAEIRTAKNITITLEMDNDQTFYLYNAYPSGDFELSGGELEIEFQGLTGEYQSND